MQKIHFQDFRQHTFNLAHPSAHLDSSEPFTADDWRHGTRETGGAAKRGFVAGVTRCQPLSGRTRELGSLTGEGSPGPPAIHIWRRHRPSRAREQSYVWRTHACPHVWGLRLCLCFVCPLRVHSHHCNQSNSQQCVWAGPGYLSLFLSDTLHCFATQAIALAKQTNHMGKSSPCEARMVRCEPVLRNINDMIWVCELCNQL